MRFMGKKSNLKLLVRRPIKLARFYWVSLVVLTVGCALDAITTMGFLRVYGGAAEVHPVAQYLFFMLPPEVGAPLAKLAQFVAAILVANVWRFWTRWLLLLAGVLYTLAAISNHFQLL
jgi:hypothetical protein